MKTMSLLLRVRTQKTNLLPQNPNRTVSLRAVRNTSGITMIKPPHSPNRSRSYTKKMYSWEFWARFFSAISGIATAALAMLGYRIFSGANKNKGVKSSVASIVTSVIATLLMLLLAEFVVYSFVMSKNYGLTIFESMSVMPELLRDAEFRKYFITDVLGVWLFAAIGMSGYIWSLVKKGKTA